VPPPSPPGLQPTLVTGCTGNDEADLFWTTVGKRNTRTELPFVACLCHRGTNTRYPERGRETARQRQIARERAGERPGSGSHQPAELALQLADQRLLLRGLRRTYTRHNLSARPAADARPSSPAVPPRRAQKSLGRKRPRLEALDAAGRASRLKVKRFPQGSAQTSGRLFSQGSAQTSGRL
jgi:hypothetical protein